MTDTCTCRIVRQGTKHEARILDRECPTHAVVTRATHCSCGRPAREVLDTERFGPVGYCGLPGASPLDACCGGNHSMNVHHVYGSGR